MTIFTRDFWLTKNGLIRPRILLAICGAIVLLAIFLAAHHFAVPYDGPIFP